MKKKLFNKSVIAIIASCFYVTSFTSCGNDEPSTKDDDIFSKENLCGAWRLMTEYDNWGILWFFPNNKCYSGSESGTWKYNPQIGAITTSLSTFTDITITEYVDLDQWKGFSNYWGTQLVTAFKRPNEVYMEGIWNMIELEEGYDFPITQFYNVRFPNNQILGECVIKSGYNTYYASLVLENPYSDNLKLTITYDKLYDNFVYQSFTCGGKLK